MDRPTKGDDAIFLAGVAFICAYFWFQQERGPEIINPVYIHNGKVDKEENHEKEIDDYYHPHGKFVEELGPQIRVGEVLAKSIMTTGLKKDRTNFNGYQDLVSPKIKEDVRRMKQKLRFRGGQLT